MTIEEDIVHDVQLSLSRCAVHSSFFDRFASHIKAGNVSLPAAMGQSGKLLREDLVKLVMCAGDEEFARRPGGVAFPVPPLLSKFWVEALMMTVREFDERFTPELERKWRTVLQKGLASSGRIKLPA